VWILQELVLTSNAFFACGEKLVHWDHFGAALLFIQIFPSPDQFVCGTAYNNVKSFDRRSSLIFHMWRTYQRDDGLVILSIMLGTTCNASRWGFLDASDPRDKVFALLGIADDAVEPGLHPDYSKSCETVFTEATEALLREQGPNILSFCQWPKKLSNIPSWVPDWSSPLNSLLVDAIVEKTRHSATGSSKFSCAVSEENCKLKILSISGARVDTIYRTGNAYPKKKKLVGN
jgi:hypothetical protein